MLCDRHAAQCLTPVLLRLLMLLLLPAGKEDVWQYWFERFSQQYAGLPSLGRLEDIYRQHDVSDRLWWCAVCAAQCNHC